MSALPISSLRTNTFFISANLFALAHNSFGDVIPVKAGIQTDAPACSLSQESAFAKRPANILHAFPWVTVAAFGEAHVPILGWAALYDSQVRNGAISRWVRS